PEVFGVTEMLEYRLYRTFRITVNDCRRLPKDLEAYCEIMLDDQRRARTSTRIKASKNSDQEAPFWRDSFEFADLAPFTKGITINVIQAKGSKSIPFGKTQIPVRNNDDSDEGWYPIIRVNDRTKSKEHPGDLRLKLKYEEQIVLPLSNYNELLEIIVNFQENNVISKLAELVPDLEGFAKNVLRILVGKNLAIPWLNSLIDEEIAEADPTRVNTLFRGNTLLTKALDAYMRLVGTEYLDDTLGDILRNICLNKVACEVDPSRLDKKDDIQAQWKTLMYHTRRRLKEKFSNTRSSGSQDSDPELIGQARYTGVSGFVFLRLICPAILGPRLFHIVKDHPEPHAHRTLTLIAKSLQGLANLVTFGTKESWMIRMNEFILENMTSLKNFIDQICTEDGSSGIESRSNSENSLALQVAPSSASTSSSVFRLKNKAGSIQGSVASGFTGGPLSSAPTSTPGSQSRNSMQQLMKDSVLPPRGTNDLESLVMDQDMPLLPHLIDLGRELALFTKTVARVIDSCPELYEDFFPVEGSNSGPEANRPGHVNDGDQDEEDENILRTVARACLFLLNTIKDRVDLSVEFEQKEQQRAELSANGFGRVIQGMEGIQDYPPGKMSRETSRDGEESIVIFETYDNHDVESFDGFVRGGDSDDERSLHDI
ncbi:hypothetical protein BGZ46_001137, partial [Entomortierella lignicola]